MSRHRLERQIEIIQEEHERRRSQAEVLAGRLVEARQKLQIRDREPEVLPGMTKDEVLDWCRTNQWSEGPGDVDWEIVEALLRFIGEWKDPE